MSFTIYHNARCSNSRGALALLNAAGIMPVVVDYMATPPSAATLTQLLSDAGLTARELIRSKEAAYAELGLDRPELGEAAMIEAMCAHPALINRPLVSSPVGTLLCRPPERVQILIDAFLAQPTEGTR
ncbi:arsenate reductase (glutaredoxin) [Ideonella margarita]|uniref:Arsenate reductase n=1 Tax=Ideonella margarita TaxID=2984191 RepID=A0ABU9C3H3_9BURK